MDKELEAIVEIEKLLVGMEWMQKHRVLDFIKARATYDPQVDGYGQAGMLGVALDQRTTDEH